MFHFCLIWTYMLACLWQMQLMFCITDMLLQYHDASLEMILLEWVMVNCCQCVSASMILLEWVMVNCCQCMSASMILLEWVMVNCCQCVSASIVFDRNIHPVIYSFPVQIVIWGCHGRDRMVEGFTNTFAISAYHH